MTFDDPPGPAGPQAPATSPSAVTTDAAVAPEALPASQAPATSPSAVTTDAAVAPDALPASQAPEASPSAVTTDAAVAPEAPPAYQALIAADGPFDPCAGPPIEALPSPEQVLGRLRRLGTLFRTLLIAQVTAGILLTVVGLLEWLMPGVLPLLFRGYVTAWPVIGSLAGFLLALDVASAVIELKKGRVLAVERTPLRRVVTLVSFVPGMLLLRRLLILALAAGWLLLLFAMLVLWVAVMIVLGLPMRIWAGLNRGVGRAVDLIDLALSELFSLATRGLAAFAASPMNRVGHEEDVVLPLLHRQAVRVRGRESREASRSPDSNEGSPESRDLPPAGGPAQ